MNQTIGVNIVPQSPQPTLHYSQGDVGRVFVVNVTDYDIPTGATVTCVATKPSGMGFTVSGTVSGNSVTFTSTAEMTDEWGRFPAEIRIASGNTLLGTANLLMIGEKDPHPASTIDGTQEELIPQLTLLVNRVEAAAESVHDLTVSATTLAAGSDATATYDSENNSIEFGIPRGADGDVTRSEFNDLKSDISEILTNTKNLVNIDNQLIIGKAWNGGSNSARAIVNVPVAPSTKYTISFDATGFELITAFEKENLSDTTNVWSSGITSPFTRTSGSTTHCLCIQFNKTAVSKADFANVNLQVEYNSVSTPYIQGKSAYDVFLRNDAITYVTPEMFGAWGDGVHDDTAALQAALDTGKNVIANKKYKITSSLVMTPTYKVGQKFEFNSIICSTGQTALICLGRNGYINGLYLESAGTCLYFTSTSGNATYNWDVRISVIVSTVGTCITMGGEYAISEIDISAERLEYYANGVNFNLTDYWVGQVTFRNMTISTTNPLAGYAFYANCSSNGLTGLTVYNVSLEGATGGFNFINQNPNRNVETLNCFGLRTSELSVRDHFNVLRYNGSGIMRGVMCLDAAMISSFDFSNAPGMKECFIVQGRLMGEDTSDIYGMAIGQSGELKPIRLSNLI